MWVMLGSLLAAVAHAEQTTQPLAVPKTPEGLWIGSEPGSKVTSVMVSIRRWPDGKYGFDLRPFLSDPDLRWCSGGGLGARLGTVECAPCDRHVELRAVRGTLTVRAIGKGWSQHSCDFERSQDGLKAQKLVLRRADAFAWAAIDYPRVAAASDRGSSGGHIMRTSLGNDPERTARALMARVVRAYLATGRSPWVMLLDDAVDLLAAVHANLLTVCRGVPDAGGGHDQNGRCDDQRVGTVVDETVKAYVARDAQRTEPQMPSE